MEAIFGIRFDAEHGGAFRIDRINHAIETAAAEVLENSVRPTLLASVAPMTAMDLGAKMGESGCSRVRSMLWADRVRVV